MIDARRLRRRLGVREDGELGPITYAALFAKVAGRSVDLRVAGLGSGAVAYFPGLIDTPLRLSNFLGQTCVEANGYRSLREIWGPTPAQRRYEGRRDLGNVKPGDGFRYRGRGLLQITGRANYADIGARLGIDLVGSPELAERPDIAVATACDFWRRHDLNRWADANNTVALSRAINLGNPNSDREPNHLAERQVATARAYLLVNGDPQ